MDKEQFRSKWQQRWFDSGVFAAEHPSEKPPYYVLDMFPYPSGSGLHVGHSVGYIATDIIARRKRMEGYNVLHPMGWDAFGLPAEQYAIKTGIHPAKVTEANCQNFKRQLMSMGLSYDWGREINTSDKQYYRWTQFLFLELYKRGLVYEKEEDVWWCEALQTVLSNEEVINGRSERGDHPCFKKPLKQWMIKITDYAERLLEDLDALDWPESVKKMQREWIGRTEGLDVSLKIEGDVGGAIVVLLADMDMLYNATGVFISPRHPFIKKLASGGMPDLLVRLDALTGPMTAQAGFLLGICAYVPVLGRKLPICVLNDIASDDPNQAILATLGYDPKIDALISRFGLIEDPEPTEALSKGKKGQSLSSAPVSDYKRLRADLIQNHGSARKVRYRLRDWIFSRQRYWGEPFPLYRTDDGNVVPARSSELPIELPDVDSFKPDSDGASPLQRAHTWVNQVDPSGRPIYRVTDTMPGWAGSCWYYLRFMDPLNVEEPFSNISQAYWQQVDLYVGGAAHATMHLLYARFWHKVLFDAGLVDFKEPFKKLFNQGLVTANAFKDSTGRVVAVDEAEHRNGMFWLKNTDDKLDVFETKMSKSLLNVVTPDEIISAYGVDTFRIYMMFIGPLGQNKRWDVKGISGCQRFLERVWKLFAEGKSDDNASVSANPQEIDEVSVLWAKALAKINSAFECFNFNTAIAAFMGFIGYAEKNRTLFCKTVGTDFIKALFPFAPHICSEIWEQFGYDKIDTSPWPSSTVTIQQVPRIFVNGKYCTDLIGATGVEKVDVEIARKQVIKNFNDRKVVKIIYVKNKVVNFILEG